MRLIKQYPEQSFLHDMVKSQQQLKRAPTDNQVLSQQAPLKRKFTVGKRAASQQVIKRENKSSQAEPARQDDTAHSFMKNHDSHKRTRTKRETNWNDQSAQADYGLGYLKERLPLRFHSKDQPHELKGSTKGEMMGLLSHKLKQKLIEASQAFQEFREYQRTLAKSEMKKSESKLQSTLKDLKSEPQYPHDLRQLYKSETGRKLIKPQRWESIIKLQDATQALKEQADSELRNTYAGLNPKYFVQRDP